MPEYTVSLLIWVLPIVAITVFFKQKSLLTPPKRKALGVTIAILALVGILLDLVFARSFFTFPDKTMTIGWEIAGIPIEEFLFYVTGFWFLIFLYVFLDEWYLVEYNPPDAQYVRYKSRLPRMIYVHRSSLYWGAALLVGGYLLKRAINPGGSAVPGYFFFLALVAYTPMILFYRVTRRMVNWRAFAFTLTITLLISVIWEATLALPRGYWGYQESSMLGVYIGVWDNLPVEAVSVWIFCTLVIPVYEFLKIWFFTPEPAKAQDSSEESVLVYEPIVPRRPRTGPRKES